MKKKTYFELKKELKSLSTIGNKTNFYDKDTDERYGGEVVDEVSQILLENKDYKFFIQKIGYKKERKFWYRFCYYVITKKRDKIVFGQFASHMSQDLLKLLLKKAKKKGFF